MNNRKKFILAIVIIACIAIIFGIYKIVNSIAFNQNGEIVKHSEEHNMLIETIKNTENKNERNNKIEFLLQQELITQEEANELY